MKASPGLVVAAAAMAMAMVACGEVHRAEPDAAEISIDAPRPTVTVQVMTTGDDASDGLTMPVKTLKRAIAIATSNGAITAISLAPGKYGATNGEAFPYTVPADVTIQGAAAGGSILAGGGAEDGLKLDTGTLQDLELQDFQVAIRSSGTAALSNIKIRTSMIGVVVETTGRLTAGKLDITGTASVCTNVGVRATGSGLVTAGELTVHGVGTVVDQIDQSTVAIAMGNVVGDPACKQTLLSVSGKSLTLTDTMIDGGPTGINFTGGATTATLTNTTIAGTSGDAMTGRVATLEMTGGELRDNARGGIEVVGGRWTFTNVGIKGNPVFGVDLRGGGATTPGTLVMHGSTVTGNGTGVYLFDNAIANLGTAAIPGNNTTQGNAGVGLSIDGISGPTNIDAAGNTWRPNVQGASAQGTYAAVLLNGPVLVANANNFSIAKGWTLKF